MGLSNRSSLVLIPPIDRQASATNGLNRGGVMPQKLKRQKRVGRFFWKNLEAKLLNFELASPRSIKSRCKRQEIQFTRPL